MSKPSPHPDKTEQEIIHARRWRSLLALLIALEILSAALYLGVSGQAGFPLDDAWIHQTYARNLGLHGQMAFSPGQPSTGSTSPGWTALLAAGYVLRVPFQAWAYLWGSIFAVASAYAAALLSYRYFGTFRRAVLVGVICILEWHLAWAALSGMEISLFTFLSLLVLLFLHDKASPVWMGLFTGLAFLVRPEGVVLALFYALKLFLANRRNPGRFLHAAGTFAVVFLIVISPWVAFNLTHTGRPFPSTIASKFIQYGYPWSLWNSLKYLLNVGIYFLEGPLMLLVPFAGVAAFNAFRWRRTDLYDPLAWFLTPIGLYAVALPAIYHHGRYLMPLIPILAIFGIEGLFASLGRLPQKSVLRPAAWLALAGMVLALWVNGALTFALQIKLLAASHMQAARWVDANTPKQAILATHDIGIIGYVTERQIVDLAGLVTPEVIPIMSDQEKLADFVLERGVSHVIVFSGYYRQMLAHLDARLVFSPSQSELRGLGLEPFEVYEIIPDQAATGR